MTGRFIDSQPPSAPTTVRKPPEGRSEQDPFSLETEISASQDVATYPSALEPDTIPPDVAHDTDNPNTTHHPFRSHRLSLAASIARDKTTTALANISLRNKKSSNSLHSSSSSGSLSKLGAVAYPHNNESNGIRKSIVTQAPPRASRGKLRRRSSERFRTVGPESRSLKINSGTLAIDQQHTLERIPSPSRTPTPPSISPAQASPTKMHQTSSRLLRMTEEERPFTRDFKDLFATLIVSLPLSPHRIRFQKVEHTFTSEEAINNLGSLKFSQSNRMPDPKDPTRIVTTTTTTTFSMAKEMARSVCQRFMDARFIENADQKPVTVFPLKGAIWQLTPKGMHLLTMFCQRNGINQRHVLEVLDSPRNTMQLVILERDGLTDKLSHDRATIEVIFRRFVGQEGPNLKSSTSTSDSDSLSDYYNGLIGVKMAKDRKIMDKMVSNSFTGKAAVDWLMDCCTTVDRRESYEVAELFVQQGLIKPILEDKVFIHQNPGASKFQPTKGAIYVLTEKGQVVAGWREAPRTSVEPRGEAVTKATARTDGRTVPRDSNNNRLMVIVNDAALRLLFREFLRDTHCEENLAFYLEVREFTISYDNADRAKLYTRLDAIRESLAAAYGT